VYGEARQHKAATHGDRSGDMNEVMVGSQAYAFRYPRAKAVQTEDGWHVDEGRPSARPVVPRGIALATPPAKVADWGSAPAPVIAEWTLAESTAHLQLLATIDDPEARARHLALHLRTFGGPDCCVEGRPLQHSIIGRDACAGRWSRVEQVVTWARRIDAIDQALRAVWLRREPPKWVWQELLDLMDAETRAVHEAEAERDGQPPISRVRQAVELASMGLLVDGNVRPSLVWKVGIGPGLALVVGSVAGLSAFQVVNAGGRDAPEPTYPCGMCGGPARSKRPPRDDEAVYCSAECRTKARTLQRRAQRERQAKGASNG
jgi:hypothetical protein